jgi:hypothetical protein
MELKKNEKKMLIILGIVLAIAVPVKFLTKKKKPVIIQKAVTTISNTVNKITGENAAPQAEKRSISIRRYDKWGRDPFADIHVAKQKAAENARPKLKGILWMNGKPYVMVDDVVLEEGQEKNGIKIEKIDGRKVFCRKRGQPFTLQWSEPK